MLPNENLEVINTGQFMIISAFDEHCKFEPGDWIGVYFEGNDGKNYNCGCGEYKRDDMSNTPIIAQGDDWTEVGQQGFYMGDYMNFFLYRNNKFYEIDINKYTIGFTRHENYLTGTPQFDAGAAMIFGFDIQNEIEIKTLAEPTIEPPVTEPHVTYVNNRIMFDYDLKTRDKFRFVLYKGRRIVRQLNTTYWYRVRGGYYYKLKSGDYKIICYLNYVAQEPEYFTV